MTTWRMRILCWMPKATETHSEYVFLIVSTSTMVARKGLIVTFKHMYMSWLIFQHHQKLRCVMEVVNIYCEVRTESLT